MNKLLLVPCVASLFVFTAVVMVRGSQISKRSSSSRSEAVSSAGLIDSRQPNESLLTLEAAEAAVLAGWPLENRMAFFSRRGPTSTLSANAQWHFTRLDQETADQKTADQKTADQGSWKAEAFIGQLNVYAQSKVSAQSLADMGIEGTRPSYQQLPICVDRVTGMIGIHADGQWQPYLPWLEMNLPKLKKATGFGEATVENSLSMLQ